MKAILIYGFVVVLGLGLAWIIGMDGPRWEGLPVTFICAVVAYVINWIVFIPSWFARSEKFYDLTGSLTFLSVAICAIVMTGNYSLPALVVVGMVAIWCLRLGLMLFARIGRSGEDVRFRQIKQSFVRFFGVWTLQGLWVVMTLACALVLLTSQKELSFDLFFIIGGAMWLIGFIFEVVADNQKNRFRSDQKNRGAFITTGLWSWSQHPNYFGEILLWSGIAVIALPHLEGWNWAALVSPVFVYLLLTRVSGIPMLDGIAKKRWGDNEEYLDYLRRTSKLIPVPPKSHRNSKANAINDAQ